MIGKGEPRDERVMWTRGAKSEQREQMVALAGEGEKTTLIGGDLTKHSLTQAGYPMRFKVFTFGSSFLIVEGYINLHFSPHSLHLLFESYT